MKFLFLLIGIFLGALVDAWTGAVFGGFIGLLAGALVEYRTRLLTLEGRVNELQAQHGGAVTPPASRDEAETGQSPAPEPEAQDRGEPETTIASETVTPTVDSPAAASEPESVGTATAAPGASEGPPPPTSLDPIIAWLRRFFTTGNVVVKVGVIVLFFGVAFLLKYAADRNAFPIELRLAAVALGAIGMLVVGWRLRRRKPNYALVLQGGAVGILYLTVFYAARIDVLPLGLAFFIMLGLVVFSCLLAVIQNARALATFATAGGFLAPVLTSTGEGSHVALFSYYALLNAGILGIAWYKAWRVLNWVGFVFTFVIASLWGYRYYEPAYFSTTEPFLILFFLFYLSISILFAHRQPPRLKGLVDGTLVFGTPLVGFTLQSALVREYEFGLALSALAVAGIYLALARFLWHRQGEGMRMLSESFLALGVVFASLAIPFALDGRWTAAAWALEGAGMTWIGIRQQRLLPRVFGLLLHIGGAVAFLSTVGMPRGALPVLNSAYVGGLLISLGGLFSAYQFYRHQGRVRAEERDLHVVLLIWGLCWWFGAGLVEIDRHVASRYSLHATLLFIALSLFVLAHLTRRLAWWAALHTPVLLLPVMALIALGGYLRGDYLHPFVNYGYIPWLTVFGVQYWLLYRCADTWNTRLLGYWHSSTLWLVLFIAAWLFDYWISHSVPGFGTWGDMAWGLIPTFAVAVLLRNRQRFEGLSRLYRDSYLGSGLFPVVVFMAMWVVVMCFREGNPAPLPYIPILNPLEFVQIYAMMILYEWLRQQQRATIPALPGIRPADMMPVLAAIAFLWLNALIARAVHFYGGVAYSAGPLFQSDLFQASIAIAWTLVAFFLMGLATRIRQRRIWFIGGGLLAVVVVKLFLIDLAGTGTVNRIVSFITVGGLMLLIGYLSPVPPKTSPESDKP